nr:MAG TPA: hypothetical protein [Caudoviricetes sp.]
MAFGEFTITYERRECVVDGKVGYFCCWEQYANVVEPSPMTGGHPGGQLAAVYAIVEFDDGVRRVNIADIKFMDEMHKSLERMQLDYDATMKTWEDAFVVGGRVQGGHMSNGNKSV